MLISRRVVPVVALALLASAGPLALRADADVAPEQGVLLPQRVQQTPSATLMSASNTLFLLKGGKDADQSDHDVTYQVVRRADSQVLRTFAYTPTNPYDFPYTVVGDDLVRLVRSGATQTVEVTDAATGAAVHSIDVSDHTVLHADADWALVATPADGGGYALQIDRADGTSTSVTGLFTQVPTWVGAAAGNGYVRGSDGNFAIDIATGDLTTLPVTVPERLMFVTENSLITFNATSDEVGAQTDRFRSLDRTTFQESWAVDVPTDSHNYGYVALGTGIAMMYAPDGATTPVSNHLDLRPVDLASGELGAPVVSDTYTRLQLADGKLALTLNDTPSGRLVVADGTEVSPAGDLPDVHARALSLGLSGSTVYATWADQDGVWTTNADGSGTWADTNPSPGFTPDDSSSRAFVLGSDVVMAIGGDNGYGSYHLTWPGGGRRDFTAYDATLSHGGKYLQINTKTGTTTKIVEAKTGTVVTTVPKAPSVIDETVRWVRSAAGVLSGTDLVTNQTTSVSLPTACANASLYDIRGRWAQLGCTAGQTLLDLQDPTHTVVLPPGGLGRLGAGYAVQLVSPDGGLTHRAVVTSAVSGVSRTYGPVRSTQSYGVGLAVNVDGSTAQMVYADRMSQVRVVDLSWVNSTPAVVETATPAIRGTARVGSTLAATSGAWNPVDAIVTYQWLANNVPIVGATTASLPLLPTYVGKRITVRVTASKPYFTSASDISAAVTVLPGVIANSKAPMVRGILKVGRTLTAVPGTWSPSGVSLSYQWLRDGRTIAGARARTYKLPRAAKGHRFSVRVTATKSGYTALARTSAKTARVR